VATVAIRAANIARIKKQKKQRTNCGIKASAIITKGFTKSHGFGNK
jgi:hypothetical protein